MLIVRSPVRISFGGGGTDLPAYFEEFGGAVLSTAINKYFYTVVAKRDDGRIQIISSDVRAFDSWNDISQIDLGANGGALEIPLAVLKELAREVSVDLFLASEIPPGTGLGSSASVCVNILHAMAAYLHLSWSKQDLAEKAFHVASRVLGKPVGKQDEYAAAFGGLNFITFRQDGTVVVEPLNLPPDIMGALQHRLMLFFTGATHDSWSILKEQEASTEAGDTSALSGLHHIREFASAMRQALLEGDLHRFGVLLDESWQAKKTLSKMISNSSIDRLYAIAQEHGAVGGKITGAGGGGFMLLYCDEQNHGAVREALAAQGIREMRFAFDFGGSRVLVDDPFIDRDEIYPPPRAFAATSRQGPRS